MIERLLAYRELLLRPHLGHIERIETELRWIGFLGLHDLDMRRPGNLFALLDGLPKVAFRPVRIGTAVILRFIGVELFLAVVCKEMILDIYEFAILVDPILLLDTIASVQYRPF